MHKYLAQKLVKVIADNFTHDEIEKMIQGMNLLREGIDFLNACTMAQIIQQNAEREE